MKKNRNEKKKGRKYRSNDVEIEQDENFSFIAGYTAGGFPYGKPWEESDMELEEEDIF